MGATPSISAAVSDNLAPAACASAFPGVRATNTSLSELYDPRSRVYGDSTSRTTQASEGSGRGLAKTRGDRAMEARISSAVMKTMIGWFLVV